MHVIVVVCDCFPLGLVGCYGNEWVPTPNLDRLAHEGFVFDQCFPTNPSTGGWLEAGFTGQSDSSPDARSGATPLISELRKSGVELALFTDHPDLQSTPRSGAFDKIAYVGQSPLEVAAWASVDDVARDPRYPLPDHVDEGATRWIDRWREQLARERRYGDSGERSIERLFAQAQNWLKERPARDTLLWLEVGWHACSWLPPADFRSCWPDEAAGEELSDFMPGFVGRTIADADLPRLRASQAGRVAYFDAVLGEFLDRLHTLLHGQRSLIIFTADQGLPLGEHGFVGLHRPWMYEERDHVPLLLHDTGEQLSGRSQALIQPTELYFTLRDTFNLVDEPGGAGKSLLTLIDGTETTVREYCCAGLDDCEYAIRTHQWKLILPLRPVAGDEPRQRELYAKPEDRWEANNLLEQALETSDQLELQLRRHLDAVRRGTLASVHPWRPLSPG
jgi:hypothetical protein